MFCAWDLRKTQFELYKKEVEKYMDATIPISENLDFFIFLFFFF